MFSAKVSITELTASSVVNAATDVIRSAASSTVLQKLMT